MSTSAIHPHERRQRASGWTLQHPLASTTAALLAAVPAGALIWIPFSALVTGTAAAPQHRAGGEALAKGAVVHHVASTASAPSDTSAAGRMAAAA